MYRLENRLRSRTGSERSSRSIMAFKTLAFAALAFGLTPNIFATAIPLGGGAILQLSNMAGTLVGVSNACINWNSAGTCANPPIAVQDTVSGQDSAVYTIGSTALDTIKNLPLGVAVPLVDFMTVQSPLAGGEVHFDLTGIVVPSLPAGNNCTTFALSAICNPGNNSPFLLTQQSANQVGISFATKEIGYTGTSASGFTIFDSIFTTQLSGTLSNGQTVTIPNILALIASGGTVTATWSASQSPEPPVTTPEPLSLSLLGLGLVMVGVVGRKHRKA